MIVTPRIKVCGLRDVETIRAMDGLPVDEIGFVFAPSKRKVDPEQAAELIQAVRTLHGRDGKPPEAVGVFVNASLEEIRTVQRVAPLDVVQLHGSESAELCKQIRDELGVKVWRVFSMKEEGAGSLLEEARSRLRPFASVIDAALIDTAGGGTGKPFDWSAIISYKQAAEELGYPLYVAGGLNPANVTELISDYEPHGIDVSSGVETDGHKDIEKIRLFVRRVRQS